MNSFTQTFQRLWPQVLPTGTEQLVSRTTLDGYFQLILLAAALLKTCNMKRGCSYTIRAFIFSDSLLMSYRLIPFVSVFGNFDSFWLLHAASSSGKSTPSWEFQVKISWYLEPLRSPKLLRNLWQQHLRLDFSSIFPV